MRVIALLFLTVVLLSCRELVPTETPNTPVILPVHPQLHFSFTEDQLDYTFNSTDTTYEIADPIPKLVFENNFVEVKKMKVRGNYSANVRRKSFGVDTYEYLAFDGSQDQNEFKSKYFRLLAMPQDICYIENRLGFGLLREADIYPLNFKYVEVLMNGETNGVYFFIENPNDYCIKDQGHGIIIRRGYWGHVDSYQYNQEADGYQAQEYIDAYKSIYDVIKDFQGEPLLSKLDEKLDIRQYMQIMAYNYLIQNGDSTDELYFYDEAGDGQIRFGIMPWDLDDLFSSKPHELQNTYFTGNTFGTRLYHSKEDIIADVGDKLVFSIEDDIDYIVAKDPILYQVYLEEMANLLELITAQDIEAEFSRIEDELSSFFEDDAIVAQTEYDTDSCDAAKLLNVLKERKEILIERRIRILEQL